MTDPETRPCVECASFTATLGHNTHVVIKAPARPVRSEAKAARAPGRAGPGWARVKAEQAVAGNVPVKRNRFIGLIGGTWTVNRELAAKAPALAGLKGYVTNLAACPDGTPVTREVVIGSYRQAAHDSQLGATGFKPGTGQAAAPIGGSARILPDLLHH